MTQLSDEVVNKVAEAICAAMAAAQAVNLPVGSDQWFHGLARAAIAAYEATLQP